MPAPVISVAQMREWEGATWTAGHLEADVMRQAGKAVAMVALQLTRPQDRILILAGKGHNGDDARLAGDHLVERRLEVLSIADPVKGRRDFADHLSRRPALVIDGLFGIGLNRPLSSDWIQLIGEINKASTQVLSVDVPSGLNGDTGESFGAVVQASTTVTLGAPKIGLLQCQAIDQVGRLVVAPDIGLVPWVQKSDLLWTLAEDFSECPPARSVTAHKGTFGHAVVFAGSLGYHGAAVLAARGALRARPGLVSVVTQENVYLPVASQLQAAMVHPWRPDFQLPESTTAIVMGPGLAAVNLPEKFRFSLYRLWQESLLPIVADASALDWLPGDPAPFEALRVVTPHPGEAARILRRTAAEVQADRVQAMRAMSLQRGGSWVVLKGHQTLVGRAEGPVFINSTGNAGLAQGGSGDILAGFLGGLLAQAAWQADPLKAIRYGVWQHGAAADRLDHRRIHWTIEDLLQEFARVDFSSSASRYLLSNPTSCIGI
jgi:ADP-dependent NAD(P)H-hydrate dehydratase / NAD(P)H-hydrate epimerase